MQVFALFQSFVHLDRAITHISDEGIDAKDIFVVPVKSGNDFDESAVTRNIKNRDPIDKGFAFATGISVITAGIGFRLSLGPIIWGIIGAIGGFFVGYFISIMLRKVKGRPQFEKNGELPIIVIINCDEKNITKIETSLYKNGALGVNTPLKKDPSLAMD